MSYSQYKRMVNPVNGVVIVMTIFAVKTVLHSNGIETARVLNLLYMLPAAILAQTVGLMLLCAFGVVVAMADAILIPTIAGSGTFAGAARIQAMGWELLELFLLIVISGAIVAVVGERWKESCLQESQRAEDCLKKMYLQQKTNDCALRDAKTHVKRCMEDIERYSSLVLLLEEAAERIYSNLDIDVLLGSFIQVMQKCLDVKTGSIYFIDETGESYRLHRTFGSIGKGQPEIISSGDPIVEYALMSRRAVNLLDKGAMDPHLQAIAATSRFIPAMLTVLLDSENASGLVTIHEFNNALNRDEMRDTSLLSMVGNIMSIALTNSRLFAKIQDMALKDPLTQLYNRRYFYEQLSKQIERCRREQKPCCVILCDIDHFKRINDTHGHSAGDAVLIAFAQNCSTTIREYDVLARYGGEEFIFLLPGLSESEGRQAAERVRRLIADTTYNYEDIALRVTTSCGVAAYPESAKSIDELIELADQALYEAKRRGRNNVAVAGLDIPDTGEETETIAEIRLNDTD